jgi:hypothetical protein
MITITISWVTVLYYFVGVFIFNYLQTFVKSAWQSFRNLKPKQDR